MLKSDVTGSIPNGDVTRSMLEDDVTGSTPKSDVTVSFDACSKPVSSGCGSLASKMKDMPLDRQNRVRGRVWPALSMTDYAVGRHST